MSSLLKKRFFVFSVITVCIIFLYDIGNLDALRQGTEGFYLQISKDMFEINSYLIPYYRGARHWSKPFLHFILPYPLYSLDIFSTVFSARTSIFLLSVCSILYSTKWIERHLTFSKHTTFLFFFTSVGILKYSRIFMMEMPLALLTFCASLAFYEYLKSSKLSDLFISSVLLASSVLIKGPVTLVLSFISVSIYLIINLYRSRSISYIIKSVIFYFITTIIASLWFIYCYQKFGDEFYNYFFLRENLGKFNTISYPMRHVFQGLILFSLPWSFYIIPIVKKYFRFARAGNFSYDDIRVYIGIHALIFFIVWLIPTQRSHHYAIPALPFFLTLILIELKDFKILYSKFVKRISYILFFLIFSLVSFITYFFKEFSSSSSLYFLLLLSLSLYGFAFVIFKRSNSLTAKALVYFLFICWTWIFVSPVVIPSQMPGAAIQIIGENELIGYVNKPFFVEEAIGRTMKVISPESIKDYINPTSVYLLDKEDFISASISHFCTIAYEWKIWKRRTKISDIYKAFASSDLNSIKTTNVLFTCTSKN